MTKSHLPCRQAGHSLPAPDLDVLSLYIGEPRSQITLIHSGFPAVPSHPMSLKCLRVRPLCLEGFPSANPSPPSALLPCHPLRETFLDALFKTVSLLLPSWFYFYPQHLPLSNIPHDWLTSFSYCMYLPTRTSLHECWFGLFRSAHYSQDLKECLLRSWCATHICWIN